jgi:hypothetical protein
MRPDVEALYKLALHNPTAKAAITMLDCGDFADMEACALWLAVELGRQNARLMQDLIEMHQQAPSVFVLPKN